MKTKKDQFLFSKTAESLTYLNVFWIKSEISEQIILPSHEKKMKELLI